MAEHWSWLTGCGEAAEYTYSPPTRPSRPPHRPLVKVATSAHLHTIARFELVVAMKLVNIFFVIVTLVAGVVSVYGSAEVMSHVTAHYGQSLEECRKETGLSKEILEEFKHFWSDDFEVVHRELGCTLICMSNKFALLQDDARMHHINMNDYVRSFPEGEVLAEKMVQMIHKCEKEYDDIEDDCDRVVKLAACFKMDAKKAGIAPEVTMIEAVMEQY